MSSFMQNAFLFFPGMKRKDFDSSCCTFILLARSVVTWTSSLSLLLDCFASTRCVWVVRQTAAAPSGAGSCRWSAASADFVFPLQERAPSMKSDAGVQTRGRSGRRSGQSGSSPIGSLSIPQHSFFHRFRSFGSCLGKVCFAQSYGCLLLTGLEHMTVPLSDIIPPVCLWIFFGIVCVQHLVKVLFFFSLFVFKRNIDVFSV